MPKQAQALSALEIKRITAEGRYPVGEVPGLQLLVKPSGARSWVCRVVVGNKRRDIGLGGYPALTLAEAREAARAVRAQITNGVDPVVERQAKRLALKATVVLTFEKAADAYIDAHRAGWRNPKHIKQWGNTLKAYAHPIIGGMNVADITVAHVLQVLEQPVSTDRPSATSATSATLGKLWTHRTETASRLRGRIEAILDWCKGRGYRSGDNPASWKGCLDAQLPDPEKVAKVKHHAAVALDDMADFMAELRQRDGISARALEFAILTAARSGEVRGATWGEIDLDAAVWTVPASRMKAGKEHRVPLSGAALALLKALPRFEGVNTVFPAPRGGELSDMALAQVMRRMGRDEVPHGFRSTFRDWAGERTAHPRDLCEMALAHTIGNAVEASYRRGDYLERRRPMMAQWAQFCAAPKSATVLPIGKRKAAA